MLMSAGGGILQSKKQEKEAKRAAAEAKRLRNWYESKANETKRILGQEIEGLRTLRSMDLPAFQQAAQTAAMQARKGGERAARYRQAGRLDMDVRRRVFGNEITQYLGREQQQIQRYQSLTQQIVGATENMMQQANQLYAQGGSMYGGMMQQVAEMRFQIQDPGALILGAAGQALGAAAQSEMAGQQQQQAMAQQGAIQAAGNPSFDATKVQGYYETFMQMGGM
jgi:hypothetical protein